MVLMYLMSSRSPYTSSRNIHTQMDRIHTFYHQIEHQTTDACAIYLHLWKTCRSCPLHTLWYVERSEDILYRSERFSSVSVSLLPHDATALVHFFNSRPFIEAADKGKTAPVEAGAICFRLGRGFCRSNVIFQEVPCISMLYPFGEHVLTTLCCDSP